MRKIESAINYCLPCSRDTEKLCHERLKEAFLNLSGILSQPSHSRSEVEARLNKKAFNEAKAEQEDIILDIAAALGVDVIVMSCSNEVE